MARSNPRRRTHHHRLRRAGRPSAGRRRPEARRRLGCTCATLLMAPGTPWYGLIPITRRFSWRRRGPKVRIRWKLLVDALRRAIDAPHPRGTGGRYLLLFELVVARPSRRSLLEL